MNFVHSASEGMELAPGISALLQLALKPCEDVIERKATFAWRSHVPTHTPHSNEPLRHRRTTGTRRTVRCGGLLPCEAEAATGGCLARDGAVTRWVLLRLCARGGLCILFVQDTDHTSGDFVVYYCFVVLAYDVDSEFLTCNIQVSGCTHASLSTEHRPRYLPT